MFDSSIVVEQQLSLASGQTVHFVGSLWHIKSASGLVGETVGDWVGEGVGAGVGWKVGEDVGAGVGAGVGSVEGALLGAEEGEGVGLSENPAAGHRYLFAQLSHLPIEF